MPLVSLNKFSQQSEDFLISWFVKLITPWKLKFLEDTNVLLRLQFQEHSSTSLLHIKRPHTRLRESYNQILEIEPHTHKSIYKLKFNSTKYVFPENLKILNLLSPINLSFWINMWFKIVFKQVVQEILCSNLYNIISSPINILLGL